MIQRIVRISALLAILCSLLLLPGLAAARGAASAAPHTPPDVSNAVAHAVSPPLRDAPPLREEHGPDTKPLRLIPRGQSNNQVDTVVQSTSGALVSTTNGLSFAGVGQGDYGFSDNAAPPDTNLAVGDTQVVQWVNESFAVFDKSTGALKKGPFAGNTIWQSLGGGCAANNDGDPIVQFDKIAHRWIMTQFSISTTPYLQCVAVSQTSDATGAYNLYAFSYGPTQFPDYPKLGVWPDAYYITYNIFNNGSTFAGAKVCAFDRAAMLQNLPATQQCYQLSASYGGLLPADLDGSTLPPAGTPGLFLNFDTNSLNLWKFHVDWSNTGNTSLTGPINIPVNAFSPACNGGGTCIPQPGTRQKLDSLADRLMYRLAYRNFNGQESLVVNHTVTANPSTGQTGIRWYELRNPSGLTVAQADGSHLPVVYQQSTFAPDSNYRWMGSIAMDHVGDIAMGYSESNSTTMYPSIYFTGHIPTTDPSNTMESETQIKAGGGYQTYPFGGLSRWGDYSSMSVDPTDDCTMWYTTEYLKSSGGFNWSTWIKSFKFPNCSTTASTPTPTATVTPTTTATSTPTTSTPTPTSTNTPTPIVTNTPTASPTSTSTPAPQSAPAAPSNLTGTAVSKSQINLSWTDNSNNETGFWIDRSPNGTSGWTQVGQVGTNITSYSDASGLSASTFYYYRVYAYNASGNSGYSNTVKVRTSRK